MEMRGLALIAGSGLILAACASNAPEPFTISGVEVQTDLSAMQSREAVAYWQTLSADLETAIAAEFAGELDPTGKSVIVDIDELSLSETYVAGGSIEDARLSGLVSVENADGTNAGAYNVTASSSDAVSYLPEGTTAVSPTSAEYYQAIVRAFARGTAESVRSGAS
jgi:hypothetical protein